MKWTATEPSPTADATRLIDSCGTVTMTGRIMIGMRSHDHIAAVPPVPERGAYP